MPIQSHRELFLYKLAEMYDVEQKLAQALPILAREVDSDEARDAITEHEQETRLHIRNLEQCFQILGVQPATVDCQAMKGLMVDHDMFVQQQPSPTVLTKFDIQTVIDSEAIESSKYSGLIDDADILGLTQLEPLLQENKLQEEAAEKKLYKIGHNISKGVAAGSKP